MRLTMATPCVFLALGTLAHAGEPRSHDGGFFLRLAPGGGFASSKITEEGDEMELRGATGNIGIAIGAVVSRNLAIHANLGNWLIPEPTIRIDGRELEPEDTSLSLFTYGAGFTWYFGSSNAYLTASAGAAELDFSATLN
jgi:hypothetical protein